MQVLTEAGICAFARLFLVAHVATLFSDEVLLFNPVCISSIPCISALSNADPEAYSTSYHAVNCVAGVRQTVALGLAAGSFQHLFMPHDCSKTHCCSTASAISAINCVCQIVQPYQPTGLLTGFNLISVPTSAC